MNVIILALLSCVLIVVNVLAGPIEFRQQLTI